MRIAGRLNGPADSAHADVARGASAGVRRWDIPAGLDPLPFVDAEHIEQGHASSQETGVDAHAIPTCVGFARARPPGRPAGRDGRTLGSDVAHGGPDGESSARGRPTGIRRAALLS